MLLASIRLCFPAAMANTMTKTSLDKRALFRLTLPGDNLTEREARAGALGRKLKAGTGATTVEGLCLLAYSLWLMLSQLCDTA